MRDEVAMLSVETDIPLGVERSSGSFPRLPMRVTLLTMGASLSRT
jgi:hypothetical protein